MSFSFTVRVATAGLLAAALASELTKVVDAQPIHKADADAVQKAAEAHAALLPADDTADIVVNVAGWVEWQGTDDAPKLVGTHVNVTARLVEREPAPVDPVAAE